MNITEINELKTELSEEINPHIPFEKIVEQINLFEKGIPYLKLVKPCRIRDGIKVIPKNEQDFFIDKFQVAMDSGRVTKFVPASGAATRMFKKHLSFSANYSDCRLVEIRKLAENGNEDCAAVLELFENIHRFAFYDELKKTAKKQHKNLDQLIAEGKVADIIRLVTEKTGLNYANLPKGCILFHSYSDGARTAFEEHIIEGMNYSVGKEKVVKIHFTISDEHENEIKRLFEFIIEKYKKLGLKINVSFSVQSASTDTISVTKDNKIFRDENGKVVYRPGGHGALLKNLDNLKADIVTIKNIDNLVPDFLKQETYTYKKSLGGYLVFLQEKIFTFLRKLEVSEIDDNLIRKAIQFIKTEFDMDLSDKLERKTISEKQKYLINFLNRPIRVCGMVVNEGHPGGGPFWVENKNGDITKQVVETTQVDLSDSDQVKILQEATHFSPVDFLCAVKDYKGNHFELEKFANPETGLITNKSKDGRELKALELPGLWNGGMYYWLTVFVEVPKITFNPVKEINDLLKPEHQVRQ